jgi:hypothetical protein
MTERTKAHRCARCDINWPLTKAFAAACPICTEPTWVAAGEQPLSLDEARQFQLDVETARHNRQAFEDYYNAGRDLLVCNCGEPATLVDHAYTICHSCDAPDPALTLDELGWEEIQ